MESVWDVITNVEAIRVNQEWAGSHGSVFAAGNKTVRISPHESVPSWQAWYKPIMPIHEGLPDRAAILIANHDDKAANITINLCEVPNIRVCLHFDIRDVWARQSVSGAGNLYNTPSLASHDSVFIVISPTY